MTVYRKLNTYLKWARWIQLYRVIFYAVFLVNY